jgi:riboflavin synthase
MVSDVYRTYCRARVASPLSIRAKAQRSLLSQHLRQFHQIALGDSIAVNGVCLTVTSIAGDTFTADVMVQTLAVTSLSQLAVGSAVNLELAALLNTRMGGHMVQGHVDGVATVVGLTPGESGRWFDITVPEKLAKYIVNQGSI